MVTPQQAAEKFAREWLQSKDIAKTNYAAVAPQIAQRAIDAQATLLANFQASVTSGKWADALRKYVGNNTMGTLYGQKLDAITVITDGEKAKIQNSVALKQYLETILDDVLALFKAATSGNRSVPVGLLDPGLNSMLMAGILAFERSFTTQSTPQQVHDAITDYMGSHFGWPNKA